MDPKFLKAGSWDTDGRRNIYEKAFLNEKKYKILKSFQKKIFKCFASVFNNEGLNLLYNLKEEWVKIPSHEAYNLKLIKEALKNLKK